MALFPDIYKPMKDVEIVSVATIFTSMTGWQYFLVFHEALYIPELDHTLINTNQLCQFHTQVQDNPYHATEPMNVTNPSGYFTACLEYQGTNIFFNTWFTTEIDLAAWPHIKLTSHQPCNTHQIEFPSKKHYVKEEIEAQNVSSIGIKIHQPTENDEHQIAE